MQANEGCRMADFLFAGSKICSSCGREHQTGLGEVTEFLFSKRHAIFPKTLWAFNSPKVANVACSGAFTPVIGAPFGGTFAAEPFLFQTSI